MTAARTVLGADDISRVLTRIAHEILESGRGSSDFVLLGIPTRGTHLAERLAERLSVITGSDFSDRVGTLDVTMHRDDLRARPTRASAPTRIPVLGIDDRVVILVDDVLFSGRTIRAAFDALADLGRASIVRLAVLVDRGHREFPIRADFVGKNIPSARSEHVRVLLEETDGRDGVEITADEAVQ